MKIFKVNSSSNYNKGTYLNANEAWTSLYSGLNIFGVESSPRGMKIKETLECDIKILNPKDNLVYSKTRALSPYYIGGEYMWYKSGSNKASDIERHSKFWNKIVNDDGETVNSGYGYYFFNKDSNGISNFEKVINNIKNDNDTRQAVLQIPIMDNIGKKDTPCTSSIQFILRNGKLNCTVYMRSNDIWLGFPYDIFNFTMWQIEIAKELNVEVGWYRHVVGSLHLYERNFMNSKTVIDKEMFENSEIEYNECFINDMEILDRKEDSGLVNETLRKMVLNYKYLNNR